MRIMASIFLGLVLAGAARAEDLPDQRPMLRIEPGMHTARISRIAVDAACTLMVTGSETRQRGYGRSPKDGAEARTLLRTFRVPIGDGNEGEI